MNAAFVAFAKMQQSREIVTFLPARGECTSVRILGVFSGIREESRRGFTTVRRKAVGDAFRLFWSQHKGRTHGHSQRKHL